MISSEDLYRCAKVACENRDLINIAGTTFYVFEARLIIGHSNDLVRQRIEIMIDSKITPSFVSVVDSVLAGLSNPVACDYNGSITIEYDYEP